MQKKLRERITCSMCGGNAVLKYGDYTRHGKTYHDFPYYECTQCGEKHYDLDLLIELDEQEKNIEATA